MFSGIVEDVGRIVHVTDLSGGRRFRIRTRISVDALEEGASVAVDGACLTVVSFQKAPLPDGIPSSPEGPKATEGRTEGLTDFDVEAIGTTLSRTVADRYEEGSQVNLERARTLGDRLEGHLVQGHVDGIATLEEVRAEGIHHLLDLALPDEVWRGTILHGSITLNGVSLTVNALEAPNRCQVAIIPYTWTHTNLSALTPGDPVNVEGDLIGKYVGRYLGALGDEER
ncbi:MAG: riboflavin synthase [Longimicrobiales bacterium]|nr:riboflavin synthase [Longimicrobiales bacterium]